MDTRPWKQASLTHKQFAKQTMIISHKVLTILANLHGHHKVNLRVRS